MLVIGWAGPQYFIAQLETMGILLMVKATIIQNIISLRSGEFKVISIEIQSALIS